jgi:ABC-type branched-subunit amino acid transport system ATPase component
MHLRATDLCSGYGRLPVLHDVGFHVAEGEFVAVLGPNGAGKTTLMRTLACSLPVMSGTLEYRGESMSRWSASQAAHAGVGYVPQEHNVFSGLTVRENLDLGLAIGRARPGALDEVFDRFPILRERESQRAGTLSGGERQMLALSSALLQKPDLILLDEPTTGLGPRVVALLSEWIKEIAATGPSVVWVVEQNPEPVLRAADRAYLLAGGQATEETDPAKLADGDVARRLLESH